jgi:hypothetical protein
MKTKRTMNITKTNFEGLSFYQALSITSLIILFNISGIHAQSVTGSPWESATVTTTNSGPGYINWGNGVISLTDTTTSSGSCQSGAVHETSNPYNPSSGTVFNQCYKVFFGCPGNDVIGTNASPYTDFNGDGMAFTFWKNTSTYTITGNTCGGGLGYDNAISDFKGITIEFDTYSSIGVDNVDATYGGGGPGSGINDEIAIHYNVESQDVGKLTAVNAGNLEDGKVHTVCITYTPGTKIMAVSLDGVNKVSYNMGANDLVSYFGAGALLNQTWSAGKYGANNLQTVAPATANIGATIGHSLCPGTLPVKLLSFTGQLVNETVVLNWSTVTERSNKKFIIERSSDHGDWQAIGEVAGSGNSTSLIDYSFTDYAPLSGIAYYRLRQVDNNGEFEFSKVVSVKTDSHGISISPNPFDNEIIVQSDLIEDMDIKIYDVLGRIMYHENRATESGTQHLQPQLPSGAYVITIQTDTYIEQRKLIKK